MPPRHTTPHTQSKIQRCQAPSQHSDDNQANYLETMQIADLPPHHPNTPKTIQRDLLCTKRTLLTDDRSIGHALNIAGAATTRMRLGIGGGGGADAFGPAHPYVSDGWPEHVGGAHPSSQPPHRTHPCATPPQRPTKKSAKPSTQTRQPTRRTPRTSANRQDTHWGDNLHCGRRPAGGTPRD